MHAYYCILLQLEAKLELPDLHWKKCNAREKFWVTPTLTVTHPLFVLKSCTYMGQLSCCCTRFRSSSVLMILDKSRLHGRDCWTSGKLLRVLFLHTRLSLKRGIHGTLRSAAVTKETSCYSLVRWVEQLQVFSGASNTDDILAVAVHVYIRQSTLDSLVVETMSLESSPGCFSSSWSMIGSKALYSWTRSRSCRETYCEIDDFS